MRSFTGSLLAFFALTACRGSDVGQVSASETALSHANVCSDAGWCWESPEAVRNPANAAVNLPNGEVLVVGASETRWRLAGASLSAEVGSASVALRSVWRAPSGALWAVGDRGTIEVDTGNGFERVFSPTTYDLRAVWGADDDDIWAVGQNYEGLGVILRRTNGAFREVTTGFTLESLVTIWGNGGSDVRFGGQNSIFHFDGQSWAVEDTDLFYDFEVTRIWGPRPEEMYAATNLGRIMKWDPATRGWRLGAHEPPCATADVQGCSEIVSLEGTTDGTMWALTDGGTKLRLRAGGVWQDVAIPQGQWNHVHVASGSKDDILLLGESAIVRRQGGAFKYLTGDETTFTDPGFKKIVTGGSAPLLFGPRRIERVHDDGRREAIPLDGLTYLADAWAHGEDIYVVESDGIQPASSIWKRSESRWTKLYDGARALRAIWGSSPTDIWAAGSQFTVPAAGGSVAPANDLLHYDGTAWSSVPLPADVPNQDGFPDINAIEGRSANDVWAVGSFGYFFPGPGGSGASGLRAYFLHFDGSTWTASAPSGPPEEDMASEASAVHVTGPGEAWATGDQDVYQVTGGTVRRMALPTWHFMTGIHVRSPNDIYVVGSALRGWGELLHFDGATWSASNSGDGAGLADIWVTPANEAWTVGAGFAFLRRPLN